MVDKVLIKIKDDIEFQSELHKVLSLIKISTNYFQKKESKD